MNEVMLALGFFVVALLYASVGHGGATGYLALLALVMPTLPHHEAATVPRCSAARWCCGRRPPLQASRVQVHGRCRQAAPGRDCLGARCLLGWMDAPHDLPPCSQRRAWMGLCAPSQRRPASAGDAAGATWVRRMRWCQKWRDGCNRCMHFIGARSPLAWQNFFLQASAT
jgi:hypothetical protein